MPDLRNQSVSVNAVNSLINFDGSVNAFGIGHGTSFPGSPVSWQLFFRSDLDKLYIYSGSAWIPIADYITTGSSDPGSGFIGQLFYNTTTPALKVCTATAPTWTTVGSGGGGSTGPTGPTGPAGRLVPRDRRDRRARPAPREPRDRLGQPGQRSRVVRMRSRLPAWRTTPPIARRTSRTSARGSLSTTSPPINPRGCGSTIRARTEPRDASRAIGIAPTAGTGVLAEFVTTSGPQTIPCGPIPRLANGDGTAANVIYAAVQNRSGSTNTVTVTLIGQIMEL